MKNCISNEQKKYIEQIEKDVLDRTNMTEQEAVDFAFRCWQCGYVKTSENNGWISCSERLPIGEEYHKKIDGVDYYKHVLTFANDIDAPICVGWYDQEDEMWYDIEGFAYYPKAWQPLPEPYKECER